MDKYNLTLINAIMTYGGNAQCIVAMEEAAELQQGISKYLRGKEHNIPEEIADVQIMLDQLKIILNCSEEVDKIKSEKIDRLEKRIESYIEDKEW